MREKKDIIPPAEELLKTKIIDNYKREPIWVILEREMRENADKKPYNKKVGKWLHFLKELKDFYHRQRLRTYRQMKKKIGPPWYYEFSLRQRGILRDLKQFMHEDVIANRPVQTRKALRELGMTLKFSTETLMTAMIKSLEEPGVFFWHLYNMHYKAPPTESAKRYDINSMLMMSALVFVDLDECLKELRKITESKPHPPPKPPKKPKKFFQPDVKFGEYLQKMYVPCYSNHPSKIPKPKKPLQMTHKLHLRSAESYEKIAKKESFLKMRLERKRDEALKPQICNYKFWKKPRDYRNVDTNLDALLKKIKVIGEKIKARHLDYILPFDNVGICIKGVTYSSGHPMYQIENVTYIRTGYIPQNGGYVKWGTEFVTNILGYYFYPRNEVETCSSTCDCSQKWEKNVFRHLEQSMCNCNHRYDYGHEGRIKNLYFHPPKGDKPYWIDTPKVYQFDNWDDFIKQEVNNAMESHAHTPTSSAQMVSPLQLKKEELLAAVLAEVSNTPLFIPHLPKANLLNSLQQLVRKRVKGDYTKKQHRKIQLQSQRKWVDLEHLDFRARAYMIPFTEKQLDNMNFSHRQKVQKMFHELLRDFELRTRKKLVNQTRMFWTSMRHDIYPSRGFLDVFFTYMPGRYADTLVVNPYSSSKTAKYGGKTCTLPKPLSL